MELKSAEIVDHLSLKYSDKICIGSKVYFIDCQICNEWMEDDTSCKWETSHPFLSDSIDWRNEMPNDNEVQITVYDSFEQAIAGMKPAFDRLCRNIYNQIFLTIHNYYCKIDGNYYNMKCEDCYALRDTDPSYFEDANEDVYEYEQHFLHECTCVNDIMDCLTNHTIAGEVLGENQIVIYNIIYTFPSDKFDEFISLIRDEITKRYLNVVGNKCFINKVEIIQRAWRKYKIKKNTNLNLNMDMLVVNQVVK